MWIGPPPLLASAKLKFITNWMRQRLDKCVGRSFSFVSGSVGRVRAIHRLLSYWWSDSNINIMSNVELKQSELMNLSNTKKTTTTTKKRRRPDPHFEAMQVERRTAQTTFGMAKARSERIRSRKKCNRFRCEHIRTKRAGKEYERDKRNRIEMAPIQYIFVCRRSPPLSLSFNKWHIRWL